MELKKNEEYIVRIIDNGYEGEGIAKIENKTIFVPNGIEGEKVRIKILKNLKSHAYAKIIEIMESSDKRVEPECESNSKCGGCNLRHIEYDETLNIKKKIVFQSRCCYNYCCRSSGGALPDQGGLRLIGPLD